MEAEVVEVMDVRIHNEIIQEDTQRLGGPGPSSEFMATALLVKIYHPNDKKRKKNADGKPLDEILKRIPLIGERVTIGRALFNTAVLTDNRLSRTHAELTFQNNKWHVKDKSLNGIYINGRRLYNKDSPVSVLKNGDVIQLIPSPDGEELQYRIEYQTHPPQSTIHEVNQNGRSHEIGDRSIEIITLEPDSPVRSESRSHPVIGESQNKTPLIEKVMVVSELEDKPMPGSTNLTTDFERLEVMLLDSEKGDDADASFRSDKFNAIWEDLTKNNDLKQEQESDCVIIDESYYRDCEDTSMDMAPPSDTGVNKLKCNPEGPEDRTRDSLLQEVKALQKALAEEKDMHKKETDKLDISIWNLEMEIMETHERPRRELFDRFKDLKCFVCNEQFIDPTRVFPCAHVFCLFCIDECNKNCKIRKCPQCHQKIQEQAYDKDFADLISEGFTVTPDSFMEAYEKRKKERKHANVT